MSTRKVPGGGARRTRRKWTEVEYLLLLVVMLVAGWLVRDLIQMVGSDTLPVKLAVEDEANARVSPSLSESIQIGDVATFFIPKEQLAQATQGFWAASQVALILGVLLCGYFLFRLSRYMTRNETFTVPALRSYRGIFWTFTGTLCMYGAFILLGGNSAIGDLDLRHSGYGSAVTNQRMYLFAALMLGLAFLDRVFDQGRKNQEDLEGLV